MQATAASERRGLNAVAAGVRRFHQRRQHRRDRTRRRPSTGRGFAAELATWLDDLLRFYADRVLPVTPDIARRWGRLSAELGHDGADLLIAATAAAHRLAVATRNVRHFEPAGVAVIDPFR